MPQPETPQPAGPLRHPPGRPGGHLGGDGVRGRPEPRGRAGRPSRGRGPRGGAPLDARNGRRRGLSARPRHRPPRPEARQHLLRRGDGQGGRLRPLEVHHHEPPQRAHRKRRHRPLHGPRGGQRPLRQGNRHLCPGRHPLRTADRPGPFRGRERWRSADEAPHGQARRVDALGTISGRGGPGAGKGPVAAVLLGGGDDGRAIGHKAATGGRAAEHYRRSRLDRARAPSPLSSGLPRQCSSSRSASGSPSWSARCW